MRSTSQKNLFWEIADLASSIVGEVELSLVILLFSSVKSVTRRYSLVPGFGTMRQGL